MNDKEHVEHYWHREKGSLTHQHAANKKNKSSCSAKEQRETFKDYFNSNFGAVLWQDEMVN